jgi:uncharacterized membrane protein
MDIVNKYIQIYKDDITNRVVENLTPLPIKSLKYYGIYQIMQDYFELIVNVLILFILLIVVREATNTATTSNSRALLFVIVIINFAIEQLLYGSYYFLMVQLYFVMCLKQLIRLALVTISLFIYIQNHLNHNKHQQLQQQIQQQHFQQQQPQIIYNVVVNNNYAKPSTSVIDLSGEITDDEEFVNEKIKTQKPGNVKQKRKYVRKNKEKKIN